MKQQMKRLQAAVEYMAVYGWAILILAVVLAALWELGVFNSKNYVGQECVIAGGFSCVSYHIATNGLLEISVLQSTISPINITGIGCYENSSNMEIKSPYNPPSNQIHLQIGANYTFAVQCYNMQNTAFNGVIGGGTYSGSLGISYMNSVTGYREFTEGAIVARIS